MRLSVFDAKVKRECQDSEEYQESIIHIALRNSSTYIRYSIRNPEHFDFTDTYSLDMDFEDIGFIVAHCFDLAKQNMMPVDRWFLFEDFFFRKSIRLQASPRTKDKFVLWI